MNPFWIRSPIQVGHSIKREARNVAAELEEECERKKARIDEQEASVNVREVEVTEREKKLEGVEEKATAMQLKTVSNQLDSLLASFIVRAF